MDKKAIIFDFDGTLADSFFEVAKIYIMLSREYGLGEVREEEIPNLRKISSRDFVKKFNFSAWRLPFLLRRGKKEFYKIMPNISLFPEIKEVLAELKSKKYVLGILSSNSEENIKKFLSNNQVDNFDFVWAENNLFGKDKAIRKIIKKYGFDSKNIFYVGDETRDIEAAKKCGIKMVSVSWGFNDREILEKYDPDYLIDSPKELIKIF